MSVRDEGAYKARTLSVRQGGTKRARTICHLHFTDWPDNRVPESPNAFLGKKAPSKPSVKAHGIRSDEGLTLETSPSWVFTYIT